MTNVKFFLTDNMPLTLDDNTIHFSSNSMMTDARPKPYVCLSVSSQLANINIQISSLSSVTFFFCDLKRPGAVLLV